MNDTIVERIDAAWRIFLPSLDNLSEQQASIPGVCGYYSVKDVVAHLAWWEDRARTVVELGSDGPIDVEAINDRIYAEFKDSPFAELRQRLLDSHERARATFAVAPGLTEDDVKDDTWEHWEEHGEQIRVWRASRGI